MSESLAQVYCNALSEVEALGRFFEKAMKRKEPKFSAKKFTSDFELLLQHSFLELAVYDSDMNCDELRLVKIAMNYADICKFSQTTKYKMTWGELLLSDPVKTEKWLKDIKMVLSGISDDFAVKFAAFDSVRGGCALDKVKKGVLAMTAIISRIDDRPDHQEAKTITQTIVFETFRKIKALLDRKE